MDRQAFRNRMQQLKQYREQNPGKTYFDFKAYADGGITDQRTDHPIGKPKLPDPKMIRQDRLIDLGGSPAEDITYEERYKRGKRERTQQDWKSLLHGINSTFGTAASLASFIYGGGWSLTRLLNGNKSSTIGQQLSKYVLPSNTIDTAADIAAFVEEPNTETGTEIVGGILLGKERDFSKVSRQAAELVQQVQNINNTFADGGEIPPSNKPIIPEEPQLYKGKLYKDRYGRKYTEDQLADYYDNSSDEIDRFTGKPFVRGLKPVGDIEDAANMTPVGDAISAYDIYSSIKQSDWEGAGLAAMGLIPFMPMTVKQFRSKYQGITPKQKPARVKQNSYNTTVNKNYTQNRINEAINRDAANRRKVSEARNQTFNVAERLMDDPEYMARANQVKQQFGDDYTSVYADIINDYNENPSRLPKVETFDGGKSRAQISWLGNGMYSYRIDPSANLGMPVTEHELSHYVDYKRNMNRPDPHGDSNMFYQMSKDLNGKVDSWDWYYSKPTEQKAHMNQLREYMFRNGMISTRGETVDAKMMKKVLDQMSRTDSMKEVARASKQFGNINKYTKWFNSIPLLGVGAAAVYANDQE